MTHPIEIAALEREIENLIASYPELAEDETLRADVIEGETNAKAVLTRILDRMMEADGMASAITKRINDLDARKARYDRRVKAMRELAYRVMTAARLPSMPLEEATLSIRRTPPAVIITDESLLPADYTTTKVETKPDRKKIKEALQSGAVVPGATLSNGGETLAVSK